MTKPKSSTDTIIERWATFSPCESYRYSLGRIWDDNKSLAMFIGLNPSTADAEVDDPTVRRCIRYAKDWGYGGLIMTNLFAYRSTDPKGLLDVEDPIGPLNDAALDLWGIMSAVQVAAWGTHGVLHDRDKHVMDLMPYLHYLRLTKQGHPSHPLYIPASLKPVFWSRDE